MCIRSFAAGSWGFARSQAAESDSRLGGRARLGRGEYWCLIPVVSRQSLELSVQERQNPRPGGGREGEEKGKATVTERIVHAHLHLLQCDAATSVGACRVQPCNPAVVPRSFPPCAVVSKARGTSYRALVPGPGFLARMVMVVLTSSRGYLASRSLFLHRHPTRPQESSSGSAGRCAPVGGWQGGSLTRGGGRAALVFFLPGSVVFSSSFFLATSPRGAACSLGTDG